MYKEIILSYDKSLTVREITSLKLFNESFKSNDIKIEHDYNRVIILLREVDLNSLKQTAKRLSAYAEKPLFADVVSAMKI